MQTAKRSFFYALFCYAMKHRTNRNRNTETMRYYGYNKGSGEIMREIVVKLHGLSKEQKIKEDYDRCYSGSLFSDVSLPWDTEYDSIGQYIPQARRKPSFENPIGKEIIDSFASGIFGADKFPSILVKTFKDIYPSTDLIQVAIEKGELKQEKVDEMTDYQKKMLKIRLCNDELARLASSILTKSFLNPKMLEAARYGLIQGTTIVFAKVKSGIFFLEVIDTKNITRIKMSDDRPDRIESFTEMYLYNDVDPRDPTQKTTFWYRRDINQQEEVVYFPIIEREANGLPEKFDWKKDEKLSAVHEMGFCPAALFEAPLGRSIFYNLIGNIKNYSYFTNSIMTGLRMNMVPRWAVLFDQDGALIDQNFTPKKANEMMAFVGAKSIQAITPGTAGFDTGMEFEAQMKAKIMKACRVFPEISQSATSQKTGKAVAYTVMPEIEALGEYQVLFGDKSMVQLCEMLIEMMVILNNRGEDVMLRTEAMIPELFNCIVSLGWGPNLPVTEDTILAAVTTALTAYKGGLIDLETAVRHIAPYFNIIDTDEMVKKLKDAIEKALEDQAEAFMNGQAGISDAGFQGNEDAKQMYGRIVHKINKDSKQLAEKGLAEQGE